MITLLMYEYEYKNEYMLCSIGGATFENLCTMVCGTRSLEEAVELASGGRSERVDLLVSDIYGPQGSRELGLPGDLLASSLGRVRGPLESIGAHPLNTHSHKYIFGLQKGFKRLIAG